MCSHSWKKINDVFICIKCGLTKTYDNKYFFDKEFISYINKGGKNHKKKR